MAKEQPIEVEGVVVDTYPNATFDVKLANGHIVKAHIAGRLRKNNIRIILGDPVRLELSPYDLSNGRIVYRNKG